MAIRQLPIISFQLVVSFSAVSGSSGLGVFKESALPVASGGAGCFKSVLHIGNLCLCLLRGVLENPVPRSLACGCKLRNYSRIE